MTNRFYTIIMYITSWILIVSIKNRWWNFTHTVIEYRKHKLAPKLRTVIKIKYYERTFKPRTLLGSFR